MHDSSHEETFQAYTRLANAEQRLIQGSGLGLSLVAASTKLQHGHIWLESELSSASRFYTVMAIIK